MGTIDVATTVGCMRLTHLHAIVQALYQEALERKNRKDQVRPDLMIMSMQHNQPVINPCISSTACYTAIH